jgi:hypothetical protein
MIFGVGPSTFSKQNIQVSPIVTTMYDTDKLLMIFGGSFVGVVGLVVLIAIVFEIRRRRNENEHTVDQSNV